MSPESTAIKDNIVPDKNEKTSGEKIGFGELAAELWAEMREHPFLAAAAIAGSVAAVRAMAYRALLPAVLRNSSSSITYIESCDSKGILSQGTGFLLRKDGTLATALHVVEDSRELNVWTSLGNHHTAELLAEDAKNDLAILRIKDLGKPESLLPSQLASPFFRFPGKQAFALGHPGGSESIAKTAGSYIAERPMATLIAKAMNHEEWAGSSRLIFKMESAPGYSGAPVFDSRGRVWGMVSGSAGSAATNAVPAARILELSRTIN